MGGVHLRALREVAGATLAAVFSNDERQLAGDLTATQGNLGRPGERFDFSAVKQYRDLAAVLGDSDIDAVDLCLPTFLHEDVAVEALRAGKHVLVEKPMALEGAGARRMIAAAERAGRILMGAQVLRFFPEYVALRNALPGLGAVRGAFFRRRCAAPAWGGWLKDPEKSGGGVFDLLIHDIDMCLHLFGKPEAVSAVGHCDAACRLGHASRAIVLPIRSGRRMRRLAARGRVPLRHGIQRHPGRRNHRVQFRRAPAHALHADRTGAAAGIARWALRDGYAAEIEYFVECCRSGRQPERCPPRESALAVELMRTLLVARERDGRKILCSNLG